MAGAYGRAYLIPREKNPFATTCGWGVARVLQFGQKKVGRANPRVQPTCQAKVLDFRESTCEAIKILHKEARK